MGKKARIKRIRQKAYEISPRNVKEIARAERRRGRLPAYVLRRLREEKKEQG